MQLQIETIAYCNAACVFCPYPKMKRQRGQMSMELFRKIVDEGVTIDRVESVTLTGLGEPLLDKQLFDRISYIKKAAAAAKHPVMVDMYTNGSFLTHETSEKLRDAGLDVLYISLNAGRADVRKTIMKVDDYDKVVAEAHYAISLGKPKVLVKAVGSKDLMEGDDRHAFLEEWGGEYQNGGHAFLHLEGNWAGAMWPMRVRPTTPCSRALDQIMVMWDGRVSLCCFDGEGEVVLGDLNRSTIREVFAGEKAVGIRQAHVDGRRGELPLCATCTAI
jgi:hypothetical protein